MHTGTSSRTFSQLCLGQTQWTSLSNHCEYACVHLFTASSSHAYMCARFYLLIIVRPMHAHFHRNTSLHESKRAPFHHNSSLRECMRATFHHNSLASIYMYSSSKLLKFTWAARTLAPDIHSSYHDVYRRGMLSMTPTQMPEGTIRM